MKSIRLIAFMMTAISGPAITLIMVEEDKIKSIINHYNQKYHVDMMSMIKEALHG